MSDELNLTPELTLDPSGTAAQAAAAPRTDPGAYRRPGGPRAHLGAHCTPGSPA